MHPQGGGQGVTEEKIEKIIDQAFKKQKFDDCKSTSQSRNLQADLIEAVIQRDGHCVLSGKKVFDCSHIVDREKMSQQSWKNLFDKVPDEQKNGSTFASVFACRNTLHQCIALSLNLHRAFDRGAFYFDENFICHVRASNYSKYNNVKLIFPDSLVSPFPIYFHMHRIQTDLPSEKGNTILCTKCYRYRKKSSLHTHQTEGRLSCIKGSPIDETKENG